MIYWGEIKLSLCLRALLIQRVEYLHLLQTHVQVIRTCDIYLTRYFFVVLQLAKERPRYTNAILYWWILFKDSPFKKKKKSGLLYNNLDKIWWVLVSFLCLFKSGCWGQVHSWATESRVLGCRALCLREASTASAALELTGTVTGFRVSRLDFYFYFFPLLLLLKLCVQKC